MLRRLAGAWLAIGLSSGLLVPVARAAVKEATPAMPVGWLERAPWAAPGAWTAGLSLEQETFLTPILVTDLTRNPDNIRTGYATYLATLGVRYAPGLSLEVALPYRHMISPRLPAGKGTEAYFVRERDGIGDLTVFNWADLAWGGWRAPVAIGLGVRLPTGESNPDKVWVDQAGNAHDPSLQPGAGTTDPILGVAYRQDLGRFHLQAGSLYRVTGGYNPYGYRFGNELQVVAGSRFDFDSAVAAGLEARWLAAAFDTDYGALQRNQGVVANSGGHWIWVSPSLHVRPGETEYFLRVDLPVYRYVNEEQFASDFRVNTGVLWRPAPHLEGPPPATPSLAP